MQQIKTNKIIYWLYDYNWEKAELISEGPKNYKIAVPVLNQNCQWETYIRSVSKEKCAFLGEKVAVIWEKWKGRNGRGGYRVERELYPNDRIEAEHVLRQSICFRNGATGRITETAYGVKEE